MLLILEYVRQNKLFHKKFKNVCKVCFKQKNTAKHLNLCDTLTSAMFSAILCSFD